MTRFQITFAKTKSMRFTSNLDLLRTWERIFRRAKLPIAYSQGFNPRPKFNLASPLPLGFTSEAEVLDVWFEHDLDAEEISQKLEKTLPPGIQLKKVTPIDKNAPKLQKLVIAAEYVITLKHNEPFLENRINHLLTQESIIMVRRGKEYNLRPLIRNINLNENAQANLTEIIVTLKSQDNATGRPDEVLKALDIDPLTAQIHRKRLIFKSE